MIKILQGDVRAMLKTLPAESVHCVVTSPPYWGLRDYGTASWDGGDPDCDHLAPARGGRDPATSSKQLTHAGTLTYQYSGECGKCGAQRIDNQLGLEPTMAEHIETMVDVFREVRRVLRKDGTVWLNYGDCYATAPNGRSAADTKAAGNDDRTFRDKPFSTVGGSLKPKDLCMIPNRLAIALQEPWLQCRGCDAVAHQSKWGRWPNGRMICPTCEKSKGHDIETPGWWVRSEIIWAKPNPMPESIKDRPATAHEKVWLLSKSARYFYDAEAVRVASTWNPDKTKMPDGWDTGPGAHGTIHRNGREKGRQRAVPPRHAQYESSDRSSLNDVDRGGANLKNVWTIPTKGFAEAHFATFPPKLAETCIKAGTSEKGCCAECGAPWVRETDSKLHYTQRVHNSTDSPGFNQAANRARDGHIAATKSVETLGWSPSCQCVEIATVPCTVLDPFIGSGTTALVADRLQRDCIGIDLNAEYAEMATRRIKDDGGMFAEVS